ncbi:23S rRNA (uracil(1939)-C(5))-methyltransferase RlmD [Cytobacillus sp. FSL W7-1323]|uniref:23S rRNA (Uracil(1939)-C(5))-methyltransferase RlmD n=1 Tax=Cytobacillus kochii TaxID=859143 RepID=A0A248TE59_9BACI|nr:MULTISPECIES: 23S rRNA (uracil(1939)-C(5))-methyltransferase RlmD [Cytobacillus]ASV66495.1 23S rRNA (uracil(1939)-C(5))-methyltransferase RlmD [Cytobacillus kochii]MDQ0187176.1 23S rRNA (uracil-5-)-methyltransferase RumA [Cytobacillus kochii]MEA1854377.1 23S rRNA (uracil(1939)-C(5))-methyltransferase RlmD [Cytobacillus sp. OWB-43]MED1607004.1 23S rRNA (uracil(1939)-C(5))-methyltransferase RlmD [Cytobacillus kochii]
MNKQTNRKKETAVQLKLKQRFPLTIKRLGINGEGVGYFKKKVVFVPGALPDEEVVVEVTNVQPKFSEAKIKKVRKPSPYRVEAPCPLFGECGGCQLQHLRYDRQLIEKRDMVIQSLERHTKIDPSTIQIKQTIGMEDPWRYRNKSQFQVGMKQGEVIAGLYSMNSHQLIDIDECIVQKPETISVTNTMKRILQDLNISAYNERTRKGDIRTIVTRVGVKTGEVQVVLITRQKELPKSSLIVEEATKRIPNLRSIIQNVNGQKTSLIFGDETIPLAGETFIYEMLGDIQFELSARTFFQLNPEQTVKLYNEVKKAANLTGKETIVDAYCGVGTIGLWLADQAKEIRGMDIIKESITDAKRNAAKHGVKHAKYVTGKAEEWLPKWVKEGFRPDVIVVDPPRTGLDQALLKTIQQVKPKKLVYVSCNPSTLAKDIDFLHRQYKVKSIQPVDMFPQTAHVECVVLLTLI